MISMSQYVSLINVLYVIVSHIFIFKILNIAEMFLQIANFEFSRPHQRRPSLFQHLKNYILNGNLESIIDLPFYISRSNIANVQCPIVGIIMCSNLLYLSSSNLITLCCSIGNDCTVINFEIIK